MLLLTSVGLSNTCCANVFSLHRNAIFNAKDSDLEFASLTLPVVTRDKLGLKLPLLVKFLATLKVSSGINLILFFCCRFAYSQDIQSLLSKEVRAPAT